MPRYPTKIADVTKGIIMQVSTSEDEILSATTALVEETRLRAKLNGRPYVLGLLVESHTGRLADVLRAHEDSFREAGATLLEWRDDGLRGRALIGGEELLVSVQRA